MSNANVTANSATVAQAGGMVAMSAASAARIEAIRKAANKLESAKGGIWAAVRDEVLAGTDNESFKAALKAAGVNPNSIRPYMSAAYGALALDKLEAGMSIAAARAAVKASKASDGGGEPAEGSEGEAPSSAPETVDEVEGLLFDGVDPIELTEDGSRITRKSILAWAAAQLLSDRLTEEAATKAAKPKRRRAPKAEPVEA